MSSKFLHLDYKFKAYKWHGSLYCEHGAIRGDRFRYSLHTEENEYETSRSCCKDQTSCWTMCALMKKNCFS